MPRCIEGTGETKVWDCVKSCHWQISLDELCMNFIQKLFQEFGKYFRSFAWLVNYKIVNIIFDRI